MLYENTEPNNTSEYAESVSAARGVVNAVIIAVPLWLAVAAVVAFNLAK